MTAVLRRLSLQGRDCMALTSWPTFPDSTCGVDAIRTSGHATKLRFVFHDLETPNERPKTMLNGATSMCTARRFER